MNYFCYLYSSFDDLTFENLDFIFEAFSKLNLNLDIEDIFGMKATTQNRFFFCPWNMLVVSEGL